MLGKIKEYRECKAFLVVLWSLHAYVLIFQGVIFYLLYRVMVSETRRISGVKVIFTAITAVTHMVIPITQSCECIFYIYNIREFLEYEPKEKSFRRDFFQKL